MLGNFSCFYCRLLTFSKLAFLQKKSFRNTIRVSKGLEPDQGRLSVSPDLGPNCLQRLQADEKSQVRQVYFTISEGVQHVLPHRNTCVSRTNDIGLILFLKTELFCLLIFFIIYFFFKKCLSRIPSESLTV